VVCFSVKRTAVKILKYYILIPFLLLQFSSCGSETRQVNFIKIPELEEILNNSEDCLYVINFWATWCPPCVQELPHFEKIAKEFDSSRVKFILISVDFPSQAEKQLEPFLKKNNITLPVSAMMETDSNLWIEKVDPEWQGDIPATLFLNNARKIRKFNAGILDYQELKNIINNLL